MSFDAMISGASFAAAWVAAAGPWETPAYAARMQHADGTASCSSGLGWPLRVMIIWMLEQRSKAWTCPVRCPQPFTHPPSWSDLAIAAIHSCHAAEMHMQYGQRGEYFILPRHANCLTWLSAWLCNSCKLAIVQFVMAGQASSTQMVC